MALVVIAGIANDEVFQHVAYIADYLSKILPNFTVRQIAKRADQWEDWLKKECKKRGWHHSKSPIVWKEVAMSGGRAVLLGGANEFWEYLKEYYDVMSYLNKKEKAALLLDKFTVFLKQEEREKNLHDDFSVRRVCIIGAGHPMTALLVMELLRMPELAQKDGIVISLCDAVEFNATLKYLARDAVAIPASPGLASVRVVDSLRVALEKCDLCIVLLHEDSERNDQELLPWLQYNYNKLLLIADALKARAPHNCRVVVAAAGEIPLCFNAQIIADNAKNLQVRNVVAVTANEATESISCLAKASDIPSCSVGQPPVWGFVGLNKLVDLQSAYHVVEVFKPDSTTTKKFTSGSTLIPGEKCTEVRNVSYLLNKTGNIHLKILAKNIETEVLLGRTQHIPKVKATIDLLHHWYSNSKVCLSLGVCSNGAFGLPHGLYFSQPVTLIDGYWKPLSSYPVPVDLSCRLLDLLTLPMHVLQYFILGKRSKGIWLLADNVKMDRPLSKLATETRSKLMDHWKGKLKSMTAKQQALALSTGRKLMQLEEEQKKILRQRKEEEREEKLKKLRKEKLIAMLKEKRQEENENRESAGGEGKEEVEAELPGEETEVGAAGGSEEDDE